MSTDTETLEEVSPVDTLRRYTLPTTSQTTFSIPFSGDDDDNATVLPKKNSIPDDLQSEEIRLRVYKKAWDKCLQRIQATVQQLLEPHVEKVVEQVLEDKSIPGLPYPELPVVSISNPIFGASFLNDVCARLETPSVHIYPSDCNNITNAMRAIITGLAEPDEEFKRQYKPTTSLATFDINYLVAWYKSLDEDERPEKLLVVLHNFEEFDPTVMQDVFYICSRQLPKLPLSFILSLSTPLPTYLHMVYPRATLAHLRIRDVAIPSGMAVLNEILSQTFFSPEFTLDIIPGPASLEYVADFFSRHNRTLDSLITNIQLVHMKHFSVEPLTCLAYPTPLTHSPAILEAAFARILAVEPKFTLTSETSKKKNRGRAPPEVLMEKVDQYREAVFKVYHKLRIAFTWMKTLHMYCKTQNYKGLGWDLENNLTEIFQQFLKGTRSVDSWLTEMRRIIKLLRKDQLETLHAEFLTIYEKYIRDSDSSLTYEAYVEAASPGDAPFVSQCFEDPQLFADYLEALMNDCLSDRIESTPLWEVWYTGNTPFPSELINPSIRASILAGLLRPLEFTSISIRPEALLKDNTDESLWKLPDTSILFRRYLDSGKMINVYDWYESFQAVLDTQKEELQKKRSGRGRKRKASAKEGKGTPSPKKRASVSPKKQSAKAKGKQRQQREDGMDVDDDEEGEGAAEGGERMMRMQKRSGSWRCRRGS
ncbi:hypothetical protein NMY22_g16828 [Coprinellus aureogranulatus]|nr:hypothetical protein NMY22_g16828 [Coprinellus aureogranulatus]